MFVAEAQRQIADRAQIVGDIVALFAIAARGALVKTPSW